MWLSEVRVLGGRVCGPIPQYHGRGSNPEMSRMRFGHALGVLQAKYAAPTQRSKCHLLNANPQTDSVLRAVTLSASHTALLPHPLTNYHTVRTCYNGRLKFVLFCPLSRFRYRSFFICSRYKRAHSTSSSCA